MLKKLILLAILTYFVMKALMSCSPASKNGCQQKDWYKSKRYHSKPFKS
jgi:hypothetical protein